MRKKSTRLIMLTIGLSYAMLLNSTAQGEIPKECVNLFDQKIKPLKGKPECLFSCLTVTVDMETFLCTSTDSYCKEYCTPCKDPFLVHFNGSHLKIVQDCSKILGMWKAVSGGTSASVIRFPWTKVRGGPIPQGRYFIDPKEMTEPSLKRLIFLLRQEAWGKFRIPLHPEKETRVFGRSGFFIHGGEEYGSAGCIDLDNNETPFFTWLKKQTRMLPLEVTYE